MMPKLTLNRVFILSLLGLLGGLALLFGLVLQGIEGAILSSADQARDRNSAVIGESVNAYLQQAPEAAARFESMLAIGFANPSDAESLRNALIQILLANDAVSEATFTFGKSGGYTAAGLARIDPATVGQVALFRERAGPGFIHRVTWSAGSGSFLSAWAHVAVDGSERWEAAAPVAEENPAAHATFVTPARRMFAGRLLWTDVHWSALDSALPDARRRVEVSVQKAIQYPPGQFAGVLRVGLFKRALEKAVEMPPGVDTRTHAVFLCDSQGRLIALSASSQYETIGDDVRVRPSDAPPQVAAALARPALQRVGDQMPLVRDEFKLGGSDYLCTFRALPGTQEWMVGMVVPRSAYLGQLLPIRRRVIWGSLALVLGLAVLGAAVLRAVSVAHSAIVREAARMNAFELAATRNRSRLQDVDRVLSSLERAKTAMRSMGKYVPLDLVRRLYHEGVEPSLGGEATEVTALFTDIAGFTSFAEGQPADVVAALLGAYLEVVVRVIQAERGVIDKFIGDSVMALWNAPQHVPGHAALACRAALACAAALRELYASAAWRNAPGFDTRFGINSCVASVGHFGSPDRFNYTAIGDGINLASRLEGLNKYYGTTIIVSAMVREAAGPGFIFRHLDRVSVKGKTEWLDIYELVAEGGGVPPHVTAYEEALRHWFAGEFAAALALCERLPGDAPGVHLAARCREAIAAPRDWTPIRVFEVK